MKLVGLQDGGKIRSLRITRGFSIVQMADVVGITRQHLSNVERQNKAATLDLLVKIAEVLDVKVDDLIAKRDSTDDGIQPYAQCARCEVPWTAGHRCMPGAVTGRAAA